MRFDWCNYRGGLAGCTLASRLGEDPSVSIFALDAGGSPKKPLTRIPVMAIGLMPQKIKSWAFETVHQLVRT